MDVKKLAPWNWFKKEEEEYGSTHPIEKTRAAKSNGTVGHQPGQLQRQRDYLFDHIFNVMSPDYFKIDNFFKTSLTEGLLKPTLNIGSDEKEYSISVEMPGVDRKDITIEIVNQTLTIKGEKKQEKEEKKKEFYRMERSYGSLQRVLSLPEDADHDKMKATFKNGILNIITPRKQVPKSEIKQIEIK